MTVIKYGTYKQAFEVAERLAFFKTPCKLFREPDNIWRVAF